MQDRIIAHGAVLTLDKVTRTFQQGSREITVLHGASRDPVKFVCYLALALLASRMRVTSW